MKKIFFLILIQLIVLNYGNAQICQVDTLQYKGDANKYINIVILGDGYTTAEQNTYISNATNLFSYLFTQIPWSQYVNYFNVFAIRVISPESGAKHPNTAPDCYMASPLVPFSNPNTYLGCSFDAYNIHRLVVPFNVSNIVNILASNFPNYDQILIIANSPYYGGSGGSYATSTTEESSPEITAHEIGHSFAGLADEYYAGDVYAGEKPNMTQETNPALVKWVNWMSYNGIGIYQHCCGGNSALWYKPHNYCKMQFLGEPYCSVCTEAIIENIHSLVNPVVSYSPTTSVISSPDQYIEFKLTELMEPTNNTLNIQWVLDGITVSTNVDSVQIDQTPLTIGMHTLTVTVVDTTELLRVDNHSSIHFSTITWTINKTNTGIELLSKDNKIIFSVYPNPSGNFLDVSLQLEKKSKLSLQIVSLEGKFIQQLTDETLVDGKYSKNFNIEHLMNGTYVLVLNISGVLYTKTFIKQ